MNAFAWGGPRLGAKPNEISDGRGPRDGTAREPPSELSLSLTVRNDSRALERVAAAVDEFADRHRLPQHDRFQVQLCIEEILVYIVEHGYDDAGTLRIEIRLDMNDKNRNLAIRTVDDGRELEPGSFMFQPGPDTIQEEAVVDGLDLHLVRTYEQRAETAVGIGLAGEAGPGERAENDRLFAPARDGTSDGSPSSAAGVTVLAALQRKFAAIRPAFDLTNAAAYIVDYEQSPYSVRSQSIRRPEACIRRHRGIDPSRCDGPALPSRHMLGRFRDTTT